MLITPPCSRRPADNNRERRSAMYALSYLENNTFCILLMLVIWKCQRENLDKRLNARMFRYLLLSMIVYAGFDFLCGLSENDVIHCSQFTAAVFNMGFFYSSYLTAFLSFLYSEAELNAKWMHERKKQLLVAIPFVFLLLITPLTLKWKFFFYIDKDGNYIKGPWYAGMLLLTYGYIIAIGLKALYMVPQKKYYAIRSRMLTLSSFVICPLIAGTIQAFFTGISIICLGGTIAMVQVFIEMQKSKITLDALTETNNRSIMIQYLDKCMSRQKQSSDRRLYLLMLDIDHFKQINDSYGHLEGDRALISLSNALKTAGAHTKCLIARYGGDEFSIVLETEDNDSAKDEFIERIQEAVRLENSRNDRPYALEISIGAARYTPEVGSIPDLIREADMELYQSKKRKQSGN